MCMFLYINVYQCIVLYICVLCVCVYVCIVLYVCCYVYVGIVLYVCIGCIHVCSFLCTHICGTGFEAGGQNTPSNIAPWSAIGDENLVRLKTERSSIFERNPIALRIEILDDMLPQNGVGVYNPGYWGMVCA